MSDTNAETHQHDGAADAMATFTRNDDNTASTTQESTPRRYPLDPYLQDRRDAKAAASDMRCTQQFLESYRLSVLGRYEPDARIQLAIMPMFLFSATFYPVSSYGDWAWVVQLSPLYHGVALVRGLNFGEISWAYLGHVGVLVALAFAGLSLAVRRIDTLLLK